MVENFNEIIETFVFSTDRIRPVKSKQTCQYILLFSNQASNSAKNQAKRTKHSIKFSLYFNKMFFVPDNEGNYLEMQESEIQHEM